MAKGKQKQQKKRSSGCGFPLLLLVLLCLFVAVAYWKPEVELPEPVQETVDAFGDHLKERFVDVREKLSEQWNRIEEKLPDLKLPHTKPDEPSAPSDEMETVITMESLPDYAGEPFVILYGNEPAFTEEEKTSAQAYEVYETLDLLGRCGVTEACIGKELMPTEERGQIGMVKPSGWHTVRYDDLVDGKYLYNRCHLIGYQLTGENANEANLITGTRYMNVEGMLPFENLVADYVRETENHVRYRVTPDFRGMELVARGVQIEAWSVEDNGEGVRFHVYCYNVQPGVEIRYLDGESWRIGENAA